MLQRFHGFFSRNDHQDQPVSTTSHIAWPDHPPPQSRRDWSVHPVSIGLPRQATLRRLNSERKEHLTPVQPCTAERRATSTARPNTVIDVVRRTRASSTPPLYHPATCSAPAVPFVFPQHVPSVKIDLDGSKPFEQQTLFDNHIEVNELRPPRPPSIVSSALSQHPGLDDVDDKALIKAELGTKWILNLSMHFRDKSDREKFFVTYAETPTRWRRVTVSSDYRNAEPGSLEMDLKELQFQRDKSLQIYESIRDSLPEIQFYDTVTNLKLETTEGRLHVHVTEDVNETIPYPPRSTVAHILESEVYRPEEVPESALEFDSHLSGFVYKVTHNERVYIKKEIPGPDTVDEFLYEINALHSLYGSQNVIQLEAIVVDDKHELVKGLLISYAERGALVDLLYDYKGQISLEDRLRWGKDAIAGLSEIHDEGYVQGDFTLSNIVVDANNHAKIIDINRRGCPVGWEPPEIATKIASHQRISMYIGEKSDLYQLGMTLWGLAADDDEPERQDPPVSVDLLPAEVPSDFKEVIRICLDPNARNRKPARELLAMLSHTTNSTPQPHSFFPAHFDFGEPKQYIDANDAVEREDLERFRRTSRNYSPGYSPASSRDRKSFTYPKSSNYQIGSETSEFDRPRGRTPPRNLAHLDSQERRPWSSRDVPFNFRDEPEPQILSISPRVGPQYDQIDLDGTPFLIARNTFNEEDLQALSQQESQRASWDSRLEGESEQSLHDSGSTPTADKPRLPDEKIQFGQPDVIERAMSDRDTGRHRTRFDGLPETSRSEENSIGPSPYPPPSLSYADSGFHEPAEEDEMFASSFQPLPAAYLSDVEALPEETAAADVSLPEAAADGPPSLLRRTDTSFKIPSVVPDSFGDGAKTPRPVAVTNLSDAGLICRGEVVDVPHATDHGPTPEPETAKPSRQQTPIAQALPVTDASSSLHSLSDANTTIESFPTHVPAASTSDNDVGYQDKSTPFVNAQMPERLELAEPLPDIRTTDVSRDQQLANLGVTKDEVPHG